MNIALATALLSTTKPSAASAITGCRSANTRCAVIVRLFWQQRLTRNARAGGPYCDRR